MEGAFVVVGLFNLLLPTTPPPPNRPELTPAYYLPSKFSFHQIGLELVGLVEVV